MFVLILKKSSDNDITKKNNIIAIFKKNIAKYGKNIAKYGTCLFSGGKRRGIFDKFGQRGQMGLIFFADAFGKGVFQIVALSF